GAGKAGTNTAHAFGACGDARVVRIVSRTAASAERLAGALGGVPCGTDLDEALADPEVEAVFVATPDALHCEQTLAAARAGKHVLCEKPMCRSVAEAEAMIRACDEAGVVLMVGFVERFNQPCLDAKRRIDAGEIGEPVMILARRGHPKSIVRGRDWLTDEQTGGVLNYAGTHNIDLACWFMGSRPVRVYAEMDQLVLKSQGFTDCAAMTIRFENGGIATLYETFAYPDPYPHGVDRSVEILGTTGRLVIDFMSQPLTVNSERGLQIGDSVTWPMIDGAPGGAIREQARHFVNAVRTGAPVLTPGQVGLQAIRLAEAAHRACAEGRAISLD
ncbi:MAG: Gfo/Idh/MocA family oxidoreductase, partial [Armatimonadetes bacterium]|nr:Gfo/Idh/MocA family oxidoreductase [Armatimonadota bacterium]